MEMIFSQEGPSQGPNPRSVAALILFLALAVLISGGCGKKEPPQSVRPAESVPAELPPLSQNTLYLNNGLENDAGPKAPDLSFQEAPDAQQPDIAEAEAAQLKPATD